MQPRSWQPLPTNPSISRAIPPATRKAPAQSSKSPPRVTTPLCILEKDARCICAKTERPRSATQVLDTVLTRPDPYGPRSTAPAPLDKRRDATGTGGPPRRAHVEPGACRPWARQGPTGHRRMTTPPPFSCGCMVGDLLRPGQGCRRQAGSSATPAARGRMRGCGRRVWSAASATAGPPPRMLEMAIARAVGRLRRRAMPDVDAKAVAPRDRPGPFSQFAINHGPGAHGAGDVHPQDANARLPAQDQPRPCAVLRLHVRASAAMKATPLSCTAVADRAVRPAPRHVDPPGSRAGPRGILPAIGGPEVGRRTRVSRVAARLGDDVMGKARALQPRVRAPMSRGRPETAARAAPRDPAQTRRPPPVSSARPARPRRSDPRLRSGARIFFCAGKAGCPPACRGPAAGRASATPKRAGRFAPRRPYGPPPRARIPARSGRPSVSRMNARHGKGSDW